MPRLLLIRHGQASFGADDYDALSAIGHEQARTLGRSFAERGIRPAVLVQGAMRRHAETAAGLLDGLKEPVETVTDPDWNEFDFHHVLEIHQPDARSSITPWDFQRLFEVATARWASGEHDTEYAESFAAFQDRVTTALASTRKLMSEHGDVAVLTSGGPIAMAASLLTTGSSTGWAALNRVSVNTGVTKVIAGSRGLSLSTFNEHTHVEADPRLLTYR
ncbi:fructose 2,6-bisphosphatase [Actinoplanes philippinensis]|uniref:Broad specificity phosphatase PhoE n=1 Tax=Actinoplanes philippinensis TaxID=35752 RepID=A0A1I2LDR3_9ACTN|nr:histidine phosphatase family protein [Actinoplanes philippinensis]GIE80555.1 fructose 2,6-bisphosphatase [Actinoplanes philippinensis]SFF77153.1 Broad specificity phosphatase PhoE [Actinoplanes philippinensis]